MRKRVFTANEVKEAVTKLKGEKVALIIHTGRNRYKEFSGTIDNLYPAVFTVKGAFESKSFSYSEVACYEVKITKVLSGY